MPRDSLVLPEPPSVVDSESGYLAEQTIDRADTSTEAVVLSRLGSGATAHYSIKREAEDQVADKENTFDRNFRVTSLTSLSSWVHNINEYVAQKREKMMSNNVYVGGPSNHSSDELFNVATEVDPDDGILDNSTTMTSYNADKRILKPYTNILKLLGMRNIGSPDSTAHRTLSYTWTVMVFLLIISGYVSNILVCKYNTRGLTADKHRGMNDVCKAPNITYHYMDGMCNSSESIVPSVIHFIAFLYSFWVFKIKQSEQVEALVQKAFVGSHICTTAELRRNRFIRSLRRLYSIGWVFFCLLFILTMINSYCGKSLLWWKCAPLANITTSSNQSFEESYHYYLGTLLAVPSFLIFIVLFPILLNFILQGKMIGYLLMELRETLREKRNTLKALMQESHDISCFMHRMNQESSPAMSFILFYLAYGLFIDLHSITVTLNDADGLENVFSQSGCRTFDDTHGMRHLCSEVKLYGGISFVVVLLRDFLLGYLFLYTIFEGCKIATSHKRLVNQTLEVRVFGYNPGDTPEELDSFHHYIRVLRMRAKLFQYPMETKRLLFPSLLVMFLYLCLNIYHNNSTIIP